MFTITLFVIALATGENLGKFNRTIHFPTLEACQAQLPADVVELKTILDQHVEGGVEIRDPECEFVRTDSEKEARI